MAGKVLIFDCHNFNILYITFLLIGNIGIYNFSCSCLYLIHSTNPQHRFFYFKLFGHALLVSHLLDQAKHHIRCLFVRGLQDQFNNSDAFNGYLRSAGTNTGHGVNKAYIFTSSREREVFKGENH